MKVMIERYRCISKWHLIPIVIISGFYILSATGWLGANIMMFKGTLGKEAQATFLEWSATDHLIRITQVFSVIIASIMLALLNPKAIIAFKFILLGSLVTTILSFADLKPQWVISFIGGMDSLLLIAIACFYIVWLMNNIKNHLTTSSTRTPQTARVR